MASSPTSPSSPDPLHVSVSQEEFNIFHTIDRSLFTRLVFNLGRDPAEATQVMALWLWLEQVGEEIDIVLSKILSLPNTLLNALVDESVLALTCIESDKFPFASAAAEIPLIQNLTKTGVSLRFFHENRIGINRGVTRIMNEVCVKAFEDIVKCAAGNEKTAGGGGEENNRIGGGYSNPINFYGPMMNPLLASFFYNNNNNSGVGVYPPPHTEAPQLLPVSGGGGASGILRGFDPYDLAVQKHILNNEISEVLSRIQLSAGDQEEKEVPPDDRTIFLTFSKGYPISETEVTEFFTRQFGDLIEAVYMQEVAPEEQPLYARLVVHSASSIKVVLEGKSKAKFSINGKHVWARKYVRKNPKSPPKSSPPASGSNSPKPPANAKPT